MQIPSLREGQLLFCRAKHYVSDKKFFEAYFISMLETKYIPQTIGIPMEPIVLELTVLIYTVVTWWNLTP
jgi:hypothetical protein